MPGPKTDVCDAGWLAQLGAHGLVRSSLVPPAPIRELRDLTRTRTALTRDRARDPHDVGGHRGELDAGVLQELLQALDLSGPVAGQRRARAGSGRAARGSAQAARRNYGPDRAHRAG